MPASPATSPCREASSAAIGTLTTDGSPVNVTGSLDTTVAPSSIGSMSLSGSYLSIASTGYTTAQVHQISFPDSANSLPVPAILDNTDDTLALFPSTAALTL